MAGRRDRRRVRVVFGFYYSWRKREQLRLEVAQRERVDEALRTSAARYRAVVASRPVSLFAVDSEGVFTLSEGKGLEALDLGPDRVVGRSIFETCQDLPEIVENVRRALAGQTLNALLEVDGSTFETWYSPRPGERRVIGSTSVPGLAAKPMVDILIVVKDSSDEASYVPALESAGYVLRVREPDFHEHRMLRTAAKDVHVHVFSPESPEIDRYLLLRDHLRENEEDRELYARTKRDLASKDWPSMDHYAEAKTEVIEGIINRAAARRSSREN